LFKAHPNPRHQVVFPMTWTGPRQGFNGLQSQHNLLDPNLIVFRAGFGDKQDLLRQ
jgi:hypothetical protein